MALQNNSGMVQAQIVTLQDPALLSLTWPHLGQLPFRNLTQTAAAEKTSRSKSILKDPEYAPHACQAFFILAATNSGPDGLPSLGCNAAAPYAIVP